MRFVVVAIDERGVDWLLELRERHRSVVEIACQGGKGMTGARLVVKKEGPNKNAPVSITYLAHEWAQSRDITNLVHAFGLPPITTREEIGRFGAAAPDASLADMALPVEREPIVFLDEQPGAENVAQ